MFHLHDVSRRRHVGCCGITRALRAQQLWHIVNLLWLPNAIRGNHYLEGESRLALAIALFKKMPLMRRDSIRIIGFRAISPGSISWKLRQGRNSVSAQPEFATHTFIFSLLFTLRSKFFTGEFAEIQNFHTSVMNYRKPPPRRTSNDSSRHARTPVDSRLRRRSTFRRSRQWFTSAESLEQISQQAKWSRPPRTYPKRKRLYGENLAPSTVYYADTWAGIIAWYRASKTGTLYIIPRVVCLMVNDGPASYRVARFRAFRDATVRARCIDARYAVPSPISSPDGAIRNSSGR